VTRYVYPLRSLLLDDARAAVGLLLTAGPLFLAALAPVFAYVFTGFAVLFLIFGVKTLLRHTTVIEVDQDGVRDHGWPRRAIAWADLTTVQLRYFSTRRDREAGWMTLRLKSRTATLAVDSTIENFEGLLRQVAEAARARPVDFPAATVGNFEKLGIPLSRSAA
jgi:hypothetical protein